MKLLLCFLPLVILATAQWNIDWCAVKRQHCRTKPHIACQPNNFKSSRNAWNVKVLRLTDAQKSRLTAKHNGYRNAVAGGNISSELPTANAMKAMKWNGPLEFLAGLHVAYAEFEHDACRATPDFPMAGQNLFISYTTGEDIDVDEALDQATTSWFNEINDAKFVLENNRILKVNNYEMAGHFSVMVQEDNGHLGCAASQFKTERQGMQWTALMLTCNYESTNIIGGHTFNVGPPCSACDSCDKIYPALCKASGQDQQEEYLAPTRVQTRKTGCDV